MRVNYFQKEKKIYILFILSIIPVFFTNHRVFTRFLSLFMDKFMYFYILYRNYHSISRNLCQCVFYTCIF